MKSFTRIGLPILLVVGVVFGITFIRMYSPEDTETDETFLYASIANISEVGIFVRTVYPLTVGTRLTLRFAPPKMPEAFILRGVVQWVNGVRALADNPNPGMGVSFLELTAEERERIVDVIHTFAYVRDIPSN